MLGMSFGFLVLGRLHIDSKEKGDGWDGDMGFGGAICNGNSWDVSSLVVMLSSLHSGSCGCWARSWHPGWCYALSRCLHGLDWT